MSSTEYPMGDDLHAVYSVFSLPRDVVQPELDGTKMTLASAEDLKKHGWSKGDEYPICIEWQQNKNFGPVIGKVGFVDYNMLQMMVPWISFGDKTGWTFRPLAITDNLALVLMARIGFRITTNPCGKIAFESNDAGMKFSEKFGQLHAEWKANEDWQVFADMKRTPLEDFVWATLNQLWTGDRKLKIGGGYVLDPKKMNVRHMTCTSLTVTEHAARMGPHFTIESGLLHMECKTTFHETRPTKIKELKKPEEAGRLSKALHAVADGATVMVETLDGLKSHVAEVITAAARITKDGKDEDKKRVKALTTGGDIPEGWFDSGFKPEFQYITLFQKIKHDGIKTVTKPLLLDTDVVTVVQKYLDEARTISLSGTGYGGTFSDISVPLNQSALLGTSHLTDVVESKTSPNLVKIGAGVTFQALADKFWPESARKWDGDWRSCKCVIATPGYYDLNYVGVALSGAAGNGSQTPPVHGTIRALDVIYAKDVEGKRTATRAWIQPADAKIPEDLVGDSGVEVIADDDAFNAWKCSFGSLGIVRNAVIELEDAFWLEEERTMHEWRDAQGIIRKLLAENDEGKVYNVEVWVSPYLPLIWDKWDECPVLLSVRTRKTPDRKNTSGKRGFGLTVDLEAAIKTGELSRIAANKTPGLLAGVMLAALAFCKQKPVVLTSVESRYFGSSNGVPVGVSGSILPVKDDFFEVVSGYIKLLQSRFNDKKGLITSPFSLRFSTGSSAFLAPQSGTGLHCLIEQPIISGTNDLADTLTAMEDYFAKHGGRPHWGLEHHMDKTKLGVLYPTENVSKFKAQRAKFSGGLFTSVTASKVFS